MADYHTILSKAISQLPENNGIARNRIYDKARSALMAQLQAFDPPLSSTDVTGQRLALEECIRKVESEAISAKSSAAIAAGSAAVAEPMPEPAPQVAPVPDAPVPGEALTDNSELERSDVPDVAEPVAPEAPTSEPVSEAPAAVRVDEGQAVEGGAVHVTLPSEPAVIKEAAVETPVTPSLADEPEPLIASTAPIVPVPPIVPAPIVAEAAVDPVVTPEAAADAPAALAGDRPPVAPVDDDPGSHPLPEADMDANLPDDAYESDHGEEDAPIQRSRLPLVASIAAVLLILCGIAAVIYMQFTAKDSDVAIIEVTEGPTSTDESEANSESEESAEKVDKIADRILNENEENEPLDDGRTVETVTITLPGDEEAGQDGNAPSTDTGTQDQTAQPTQDPQATQTEQPAAESSAPPPEGFHRAVLFQEGASSDLPGVTSPGQVGWSLKGATSTTPKSAIANVDLSQGAGLVKVTFRKNEDPALSASHLIEVYFELPDETTGGGVEAVLGLILKPSEAAIGDALAGAPVKVHDNLFWIALNDSPAALQQNSTLLGERNWIDIPIRFQSGRRAVLTVEKGATGKDVMTAFLKDG